MHDVHAVRHHAALGKHETLRIVVGGSGGLELHLVLGRGVGNLQALAALRVRERQARLVPRHLPLLRGGGGIGHLHDCRAGGAQILARMHRLQRIEVIAQVLHLEFLGEVAVVGVQAELRLLLHAVVGNFGHLLGVLLQRKRVDALLHDALLFRKEELVRRARELFHEEVVPAVLGIARERKLGVERRLEQVGLAHLHDGPQLGVVTRLRLGLEDVGLVLAGCDREHTFRELVDDGVIAVFHAVLHDPPLARGAGILGDQNVCPALAAVLRRLRDELRALRPHECVRAIGERVLRRIIGRLTARGFAGGRRSGRLLSRRRARRGRGVGHRRGGCRLGRRNGFCRRLG